jgi:hypothetical protein
MEKQSIMFQKPSSGETINLKGKTDQINKAGDALSSRHVSSCDVTRAVGMWEAN